MKFLLLLFCSALLASCATSPVVLSDEGRKVKLGKNDPSSQCEDIGNVQGDGQELWTGYGTIESAKNDLRNNAAKLGANYVRMDIVKPHNDELSGTAFKCP